MFTGFVPPLQAPAATSPGLARDPRFGARGSSRHGEASMNSTDPYELVSGRQLPQHDLSPENMALARLDSGNRHFVENIRRSFGGNPAYISALIDETEQVIEIVQRLIDTATMRADWENIAPEGRSAMDMLDQERRRFLASCRDLLSEPSVSPDMRTEFVQSTCGAIRQMARLLNSDE